MGGGSSWLNPLSIFGGGGSSSSAPVVAAPVSQPVQQPASTVDQDKRGKAIKRKPKTVLTNMQGDVGESGSLHQTLGGA